MIIKRNTSKLLKEVLPLKMKESIIVDIMREEHFEETMKQNAQMIARYEATALMFNIKPEVIY